MKCSVCGFVTDPSKDLCRRCFSDLREQKKSLGLAIQNPEASYQELLAKRVKIVDKANSLDSPKRSFWSFLSRKKSNQILSDQVTSLDSDSSATVEPEQKEESVNVASLEAQKLRLSKRQKWQMLSLLQQRKSEEEGRQALADESKTTSKSRLKVEGLPLESSEVWDRAEVELANTSNQIIQQSAIHVSSLLLKDSQAALAVYFDLAHEELGSPGEKRTLIRELKDRKVEVIESAELKEAVGKYEVDNARFSAAKALGPRLIGKPAGVGHRFLAWCVDCLFSLGLALLLGAFINYYRSELFTEMLLGNVSPTIVDFLSVVVIAIPAFYLSILLFLPLSRSLLGFTLGELLLKLRLISWKGPSIGIIDSIAWNLLSIVALMTFGISEIRRGNILWRERVLGARLLRT